MTEQAQIYRKHFIPLESNPEIFTELSHKLGLHEQLEFPDVLSLDDPDLVNFLPRPVYVLALVFPTTEAYEKRVKEEDDVADGKHVWAQANDNIDFFKQTINNACGLYAIVNAVCNGEARHWLSKRVHTTQPYPPSNQPSERLNAAKHQRQRTARQRQRRRSND